MHTLILESILEARKKANLAQITSEIESDATPSQPKKRRVKKTAANQPRRSAQSESDDPDSEGEAHFPPQGSRNLTQQFEIPDHPLNFQGN
jgi:hypothetical protein